MATHILTRTIDGTRYRYFGGWSDERFHALPYIKEYGSVPPGWQAHHLTADEMKERTGPRFTSLRALPILAENTIISHCPANAENDLGRALRSRKADEKRLREGQQFWSAVACAQIANDAR